MRASTRVYSRKYLPHIDAGAMPQFLSWRLADALPPRVYQKVLEATAALEERERRREAYRRIESYLDQESSSRLLRQGPLAEAVVDTLLHDHGHRYELCAYVVMPNHVHALLIPRPGVRLDQIVRLLKGQSALKVNALRGVRGRLWQPDYFDRVMRDEEHFARTAEYIEYNPVKAGLCVRPCDWPWSSASRPLA